MLKDIETDKPDLIIFDGGFLPIKYLLEVLKTKNMSVNAIEFYPNFVFNRNLWKKTPNYKKANVEMLLKIIPITIRQIKFSRKLKISIYNPLGYFFKPTPHLKIVAVFPELHPMITEYDAKHKFVGQCAVEEARRFELKDDPELKALFDFFPVKDGNNTLIDFKFVYMSLGTIFHRNWYVFDEVIKALKEFDSKPNRKYKLSQLKVLISVGESGYKRFNEQIQHGKLELLSSILLRAHVPQLEVLKRADLFITHCGMNSTSETIKYGVPIIAIPIEGDQPIVSVRACDELMLGIRFDPLKLRANDVGDAIEQVLSDPKYLRNAQEMSRISAKYNGAVQGAKIVVDFLSQSNNKKLPIEKNHPNSNQVAPL